MIQSYLNTGWLWFSAGILRIFIDNTYGFSAGISQGCRGSLSCATPSGLCGRYIDSRAIIMSPLRGLYRVFWTLTKIMSPFQGWALLYCIIQHLMMNSNKHFRGASSNSSKPLKKRNVVVILPVPPYAGSRRL